MPTYYMTAKVNNENCTWHACKAKTLDGAKREATRDLGPGWVDSVLMIAERDPRADDKSRTVARRHNSVNVWTDE